jgi:ATP-dependent Clp protease protease subunit
MERDFYMPAAEAVAYGVVDKVLTREKNGANA